MEAVEAAHEKMEAARDGRFRSAVARYAAAAQEIDGADLSVMRRKQRADAVNRSWNDAVVALAKVALGIPNDLGILFEFDQNYYAGLIATAADGPNRVARALADVAESERVLEARKDEFIWPTIAVLESLREEYKICQRRRMGLLTLQERLNFAGQFSFVENLFGALTYPILGIANAGFTWVNPKCFMVPNGLVLDDILEGGYFGEGIDATYFQMELSELGFTALGADMYQSNSKNFVVGRPELLPHFGKEGAGEEGAVEEEAAEEGAVAEEAAEEGAVAEEGAAE